MVTQVENSIDRSIGCQLILNISLPCIEKRRKVFHNERNINISKSFILLHDNDGKSFQYPLHLVISFLFTLMRVQNHFAPVFTLNTKWGDVTLGVWREVII